MKKALLRITIQLLVAVGLTYLFLRQDFSNSTQPFFTWAEWLDPLVGLAGLVAKNWPLLTILSLILILLSVFGGRFFCGWICPVGTILDLTRWFQKITGWERFYNRRLRNSFLKIRKLFRLLRWIILGGVTGLIIVVYPVVLIFNPLVVFPRELYRIIHGMFPWTLLGLVLISFIFYPRFWCRFICPAGSFFNLTHRLRKPNLRLDETLCSKCGLCQRNCPIDNITEEIRFGHDCLYCGRCQKICPGQAIRSQPVPKISPVINEGRRDFLVTTGVGLGMAALGLASRNPITRVVSTPRYSRLLRPPGTINEADLAKICTRCGMCLEVCPTKVLEPAGLETGLAGIWTPRFIPRRGKCMFCKACGQVCPTKAIIPVERGTIRIGTARINHELCLAWHKGTRCLLCVETCSSFAIHIDKDGHPVIDLTKCTGCGACEANCPVEGSAVIVTYAGETRRS